MVEHRLAKARVASSNLVSRSSLPRPVLFSRGKPADWSQLKNPCPRRGTQVVRERSAKPLCAGSIPARASKLFSPPPKNLILKHVGEPAHRFRVRIHPQVVA